MALLSKVQRGQPITAELFNNMIDAIRECQINAVVGSGGTVSTFKRGPGGTTISINSRAGANAVAQPCPFDVSITTVSSGIDVYLSLGTVNGLMPSNNFEKINTNTSGKKYVVINCESNGKNVTSASWNIQNNFPVPVVATIDVAPTTFGVLVAAISGSDVYKAIPCGNIVARVSPSIQEDRESYVAGQRNYNQYYQWVF